MRKLSLLMLSGLLILFLTGCAQIQTQTSFDVNQEGKMDIEIVLRAHESLTGNEARTFVWGLTNSIPELQNNYTMTKTTKTIDNSNYLFYTFRTKEKISVEDHKKIIFQEDSDGSYRFELEIPKQLSEVSESEKDTRALEISVELPKEIDMANALSVEGDTATWTVYYHDLLDKTTLKAITQ